MKINKVIEMAKSAGVHHQLEGILKVKAAGKRCQLINRELSRLEKQWFAVGWECDGYNYRNNGEIRPISSPDDCMQTEVTREWNAGTEDLPSWRSAEEGESPVQGLLTAYFG